MSGLIEHLQRSTDGLAVARWARSLPLIVAMSGLILSAVLLWLLQDNERRQRDREIGAALRYVESTLRSGFEQRAEALARTAQRWRLSGGRTRDEFDLEAAVNMQSYPSFRTIGWVDPDLIVRWVYPTVGNQAAVGFDNRRDPRRREALQVTLSSGEHVLAGPVDLVQGGRALLLFQVIGSVEDPSQGFIYAAIDPALMLEQIVGGSEPSLRLKVSISGEAVYDRPAAGGSSSQLDPAFPSGASAFTLGQAPWRVEVGAPRQALGLAEFLPVSAALLSVSLALAAHGALRSQAQALGLRREVEAGEARFGATFEQAAVGLAHVGPDGRWLRVNERLCAIVGHTREELLALTFQDITHPDDLDLDLERVRALVAGEIERYQMEKRYVRADGSLIWILLTVSLVRDSGGEPDYFISVVEDIDARKRAEIALQDSERRFRSLLENSPRIMWVNRPDGTAEYFNKAWRDYTGRSEQAEGRSWTEAIHPDDRQRVALARMEAIAKGEAYELEMRIRGIADGRYRWHDGRVAPLRRDGEVFAWVGTATDIDEIRSAEARLRDSEARLRAIVDTAVDAIVVIDERGTIQSANPATERVFGYSAAELIDTNIKGLMGGDHAGGHDDYLAAYARTGRRKIIGVGREVKGRRKDGTAFPLDLSIAEWTDATGRRFFTGIMRDVTERRAAEAALRASEAELRRRLSQLSSIYRGAPVGLSYQDADGRFVEINDALAAINGRPIDEHIGRVIREVLPEAANDIEPLHRRVVETGEPVLNLEVSTRTASTGGTAHDYLVSYVPGLDGEGRVVGFTTAVLDITDRRRAEDEVRRLNRDLERRVEERTRKLAEVNAELQSFAYSVSHDLRAPLRAMQGFSHALLEDYGGQLDELGRDYLGRILAGSKQLDLLIQDLLAYSRLSREEVRVRSIDLGSAVDEALGQLSAPIRERGAEVLVERPLPQVLAQPTVLTQILANLISNALKFVAPRQMPRVRVRAENRGNAIRVWVEDNGIGIAPEHQSRIFEVFQRLHGLTEYSGTGIGLAIVRKGIERLGGRAGVVSEVGQGSRFWIELEGVVSDASGVELKADLAGRIIRTTRS